MLMAITACNSGKKSNDNNQDTDSQGSVDQNTDNQNIEDERADNESNSNETVDEPSGVSEVPLDYSSFIGDWKLQVEGDADLYRMTAMIDFFGTTGIEIEDIKDNLVTGQIYSVQGAPSYRLAMVDFTGEIVDGVLKTNYEDINWEYTGEMTLTFVFDLESPSIGAILTRDESETTSMWGIPAGEFTFIPPIETEYIPFNWEQQTSIEELSKLFNQNIFQPSDDGQLSDQMIIESIGMSIGLGDLNLSEFGDQVKDGADVVFEVEVMDTLVERYFGRSLSTYETTGSVTYADGYFTVPAMGGVSDYPVLRILMADKKRADTYYALVDYMFNSPDGIENIEYRYLIELSMDGIYIVKSVKKVDYIWQIDENVIGMLSDVGNQSQLIYKNDVYGFEFTLPGSWAGYSIITENWTGNYIDSSNQDQADEVGPEILIRHPDWLESAPRQDIPIMVFTIDQWRLLQNEKISVSAAPILPEELGRNSNYVFALPARYNYAFLNGFQEVEDIMANEPLHALNN